MFNQIFFESKKIFFEIKAVLMDHKRVKKIESKHSVVL